MAALQSSKVTLFLRAVEMYLPEPVEVNIVLDILLLKTLMNVVDTKPDTIIQKGLCLSIYFGFYRLTNLVEVIIMLWDTLW